MKRIVFVILVAVFAQNALALEDSGYHCSYKWSQFHKKMPNTCQKGDMVDLVWLKDISPYTLMVQICVPGTIVKGEDINDTFTSRGVCQYRGSFREWRGVK
jgi:hypothetical protein